MFVSVLYIRYNIYVAVWENPLAITVAEFWKTKNAQIIFA